MNVCVLAAGPLARVALMLTTQFISQALYSRVLVKVVNVMSWGTLNGGFQDIKCQ